MSHSETKKNLYLHNAAETCCSTTRDGEHPASENCRFLVLNVGRVPRVHAVEDAADFMRVAGVQVLHVRLIPAYCFPRYESNRRGKKNRSVGTTAITL